MATYTNLEEMTAWPLKAGQAGWATVAISDQAAHSGSSPFVIAFRRRDALASECFIQRRRPH